MRYCFYCGEALTTRVYGRKVKGQRPTTDHVHPKSRGGGEESSNLVKACYQCNQDKAALTLEEYRLVIAHRRGLKPESLEFYGELHPKILMGKRL